jgi:hypothetical protein
VPCSHPLLRCRGGEQQHRLSLIFVHMQARAMRSAEVDTEYPRLGVNLALRMEIDTEIDTE